MQRFNTPVIRSQRRRPRRARWDGMLPGPWWVWVLLVLFICYGAYREHKARSLPDCDDDRVLAHIDKMIRGPEQQRAAILGHGNERLGMPAVSGIHLINQYESPTIRACAGTLSFGRIKRPFGFTLESKDDEGGFVMESGMPAIIKERLEQWDWNRRIRVRYPSFAKAPLEGRELRKVFFAGVMQLADGQRERDAIHDLMPDSNCNQAWRHVGVFRCRMLVERDDPKLAAAGLPSSTLLDSEFSFQRDDSGQAWRPAPAFAEDFRKAVQAARTD